MLRKLRYIISSNKDNKVLAQNFAYLTILQIAGYIFPMVTMPYLARVIGVDGFGKIAFASGVMVWMQTISDWGFNFTATRDVAQNRNNTMKVSEIFSNVLWARCLLVTMSFFILLLLIYFIPFFYINKDILLVSFLMIPGHIFFPDWFFQAMERMRYITILNIVSKSIFTIAVFVFIQEKEDYILQPLFVSLGYLFSGIIALYYIIIRWRVKLTPPKVNDIYRTIKNSFDVFLNNLMPNLYNSFSIVLLGFWGGSVANGMLDAGLKFVNIAQQFMQVLSRVFFPFLSRKLDKHTVYARINIVSSLIISLVLFVSAPFIIDIFFTEEFNNATVVLQMTSISIFFLALSNVYGTNYMIISGYEQQLRNITVVVSFIGFFLSFPLIVFYNYIGAAITIAFTRALLGISIMIRAKEIMKYNNRYGYDNKKN